MRPIAEAAYTLIARKRSGHIACGIGDAFLGPDASMLHCCATPPDSLQSRIPMLAYVLLPALTEQDVLPCSRRLIGD
jgi:hypothetical protein